MILEAKYIGPYAEVSVPGFGSKLCKRGEAVKMRIADGQRIGGCWEIIAGQKEYQAAIAAVEKAAADAKAARRDKAAAMAEAVQKEIDDLDRLQPKPEKASKLTDKKVDKS